VIFFCIKLSILFERFILPALAEGVKREEKVEKEVLFMVLCPGVCPIGEFNLEELRVWDPRRVLFRNDEVVEEQLLVNGCCTVLKLQKAVVLARGRFGLAGSKS